MKLRTNKKLVASMVFAALASGSALAAGTTNVIVKLKNNAAPFAAMGQHRSAQTMMNQGADRKAAVMSFANNNDIKATHVYNNVYYGFAASVNDDQMKALQDNPNVAGVYEDRVLHTLDIPAGYTPHFTAKEHRAVVDWPQVTPQGPVDSGASESSYTGAGQHVYVIDTGVDVTQNDIKDNMGASVAFEDCSGDYCDAAFDDDNQHGTHVAGTIGAENNTINSLGMAPDATVHAIKVCNASGSCSFSAILDGLNWAVADLTARGEAAVANISLGGYDPSVKGTCDETGFNGDDVIGETFCNAAHSGLVVVVAAGNSADDANDYNPAGYDSVITASSYTSYDSDTGEAVFTGFSNYGSAITIAGPGSSIVSLNRHHAINTLSGTSMASPAVAGGAVLVMQKYTQALDYSAFLNVKQMLVDNASMPSSYTMDDGSSAPHAEGILNVRFLDEE